MSKLRSLTHAYAEGKMTLKDVRRERRELFREIINNKNYSLTGDSGLDVRVCETVSRDPFSETQLNVADITTLSPPPSPALRKDAASRISSPVTPQPSEHKRGRDSLPAWLLKRATALLFILTVAVAITAWLLQRTISS